MGKEFPPRVRLKITSTNQIWGYAEPDALPVHGHEYLSIHEHASALLEARAAGRRELLAELIKEAKPPFGTTTNDCADDLHHEMQVGFWRWLRSKASASPPLAESIINPAAKRENARESADVSGKEFIINIGTSASIGTPIGTAAREVLEKPGKGEE